MHSCRFRRRRNFMLMITRWNYFWFDCPGITSPAWGTQTCVHMLQSTLMDVLIPMIPEKRGTHEMRLTIHLTLPGYHFLTMAENTRVQTAWNCCWAEVQKIEHGVASMPGIWASYWRRGDSLQKRARVVQGSSTNIFLKARLQIDSARLSRAFKRMAAKEFRTE